MGLFQVFERGKRFYYLDLKENIAEFYLDVPDDSCMGSIQMRTSNLGLPDLKFGNHKWYQDYSVTDSNGEIKYILYRCKNCSFRYMFYPNTENNRKIIDLFTECKKKRIKTIKPTMELFNLLNPKDQVDEEPLIEEAGGGTFIELEIAGNQGCSITDHKWKMYEDKEGQKGPIKLYVCEKCNNKAISFSYTPDKNEVQQWTNYAYFPENNSENV